MDIGMRLLHPAAADHNMSIRGSRCTALIHTFAEEPSRWPSNSAVVQRLWRWDIILPSCVPVHPCRALPRVGSRTTGSGWFLEMQTGPPEQLRTSPNHPNRLGMDTPLEVLLETAWRLPDWTLLGCGWHEGTSDASDSRGGGGGRVTTCDASINRLAGWYMQWLQCCPYRPERPCPDGGNLILKHDESFPIS